MRSAKQAGFLDQAPDRFVKPSLRADGSNDAPLAGTSGAADAGAKRDDPKGSGSGGSGGSGGGHQHPLIQGLLMTLPEPGQDWEAQDRINWLTMAASIFKMIYTEQTPSSIRIGFPEGSSSAPQGGK